MKAIAAGDRNLSHKVMERTTVISAAAAVCLAVIYHICNISVFLTLAITAGTVCYHLAMRLAVGGFVPALLPEKLNYKNIWFCGKCFETHLYSLLKVKQWKKRMPTYNPEDFSVKKHSAEEIIQTMCVSELTHEINILLSFVPVFFSVLFNSFAAFMITSVIAALFDACFVIMQRYNRPRFVRLLEKQRK